MKEVGEALTMENEQKVHGMEVVNKVIFQVEEVAEIQALMVKKEVMELYSLNDSSKIH
jgi:hypothetical protein